MNTRDRARLSAGTSPDGSPPHLRADPLDALPGIRHGFFGRDGGVSAGIYASLNCGPGSADAADRVAENRRRVAATLLSEDTALLSTVQVHGAHVAVVDTPFPMADRPRADAMVTRTRGVALGVLAADCGPVLFADAGAGVVGAAHAGWRGALGDGARGVLETTVAAMEGLGADRRRVVACLGPCIRQDSYEVDRAFADPFLEADPANTAFFEEGAPGKLQFDLPGFILARLRRLGLHTVHDTGRDTYPDEARLFSYRRATHRGEDGYGRNVSAVMLAP